MVSDGGRTGRGGLRRFWRYSRALVAPLLIWLLLVGALFGPLRDWLHSEENYDQAAVREWLEEARNSEKTLVDLVREYVQSIRVFAGLKEQMERRSAQQGPREPGLGQDTEPGGLPVRYEDSQQRVVVCREQIYQHLKTLGEPVTKMYPGQLPLFPTVYRLQVEFDPNALGDAGQQALEGGRRLDVPVVWDSGLDPSSEQYRKEEFPLRGLGTVKIHYQLRALNKRQRDEQVKALRLRQLVLLAMAATGLGLAWVLLVQTDERERERHRHLAREALEQAERQRLEEERRRVDTERELLQQRLARDEAERQALELKSHLYASIGIMAGSYAHNIKNLLVRPNDLLRRCLEAQGVAPDQEHMLREVQQTLGTVTERLQQILHTVRRDPSQARLEVVDLQTVLAGLARTWGELAADRWQLDLTLEVTGSPLWVSADVSHLQQAVENLLFNARDATFEMRNHLRDEARRSEGSQRRQALIAAAAWRGRVVLRGRREGDEIVLEVSDNGAGMTEEVRRRCTETHFSTKRDNALYEGHSTGMGLGLSFVVAILEHHRARLEIESEVHRGTTFRARFPAAAGPNPKG